MIQVKIISDIVLDLVLKQIKSKYFELRRYIYTESIEYTFLSNIKDLQESDIIVVHFDCLFRRYKTELLLQLLSSIRNFSKGYRGKILLSNNFRNTELPSGLKMHIGEDSQFILLNHDLLSELGNSSNVFLYDFNKLICNIGIQSAYNFNLGHLFQMPYSKKMVEALSVLLTEYLEFLLTPDKKVIFLDCDNTLWNGIVGEDGTDGIQCNTNAEGIVHFHFQTFLLQKKSEGFLLGLCSKNNELDVKEAFDKLNMPLKWSDFIVKKLNWDNKPENLANAALELNLGIESIIFIDDNDFELNYVSTHLPEITTLKFNRNYEYFLKLIDNFCFKKKTVTGEDRTKSELYLTEQRRNRIMRESESLDDYVKSLEVCLDMSINNKQLFPRFSQLTEKTNQFNFNQEYFSVIQLEQFISAENLIFGLNVVDRFGDYGTVGLILLEVNQKKAMLRNYLLSCRVLGRNIEQTFFNLFMDYLSDNKLVLSTIIFKETAKNKPAETFYQSIKI